MAEVKTSKQEAAAQETAVQAQETAVRAQETRTVFLPRASETEQQFEFVCVNGKAYQVPRGRPVEVPAAVAEVLEHAQMQETALFDRIHKMQTMQ